MVVFLNLFNLSSLFLLVLSQDFWDSRVEGLQQMWETIRVACEAIVAGDAQLANTILEVGFF